MAPRRPATTASVSVHETQAQPVRLRLAAASVREAEVRRRLLCRAPAFRCTSGALGRGL